MSRSPAGMTAGVPSPNLLRQWNIAAGNFFFKHRNNAFPLIFALAVLVMRPRILLDDPTLDRRLIMLGAGVALLGQLVRLTTIGFEYIERGGKEGKVYASRLVDKGVYGVCRNPMYVGNALIAVGMSMVTGSPQAYLVLIPLFVFIYQAIVAAEENYLAPRFGTEYQEYSARVPRWLPAFRNIPQAFTDTRYNWKRSLRQDLSTMTALLLGLILFPLWRVFFLAGIDAAKAAAPRAAVLAGLVLIVYGVLVWMKGKKLLQ